ncbi:MAG TPA: patatin-like phospholipase RssA [Gammaproteobacteria bacterium]|jgi:NTE family protein|nr:patatin-like phospholipase RssA [Gammaproteobacteria bacterium]
MDSKKIGIALGSGGARGWAHIGILEALLANDIKPEIVCGSSIGALVGGAYASGHLDALKTWTESLTWKDIVSLLDISLGSGGLIEGERVLKRLEAHFSDRPIEDLPIDYAAVATEMDSGREIWIQKGSLLRAMRASFAQPGLFAPVKHHDAWITDGGLVNPVPVSTCRALGADIIIAVNLNNNITAKRRIRQQASHQARRDMWKNLANEWLPEPLSKSADQLIEKTFSDEDDSPAYTDVMLGSINIMQDRITRSRMAGDPPDILLNPRLGHLGVMDYDSASQSIAEGHACVQRMLPALHDILSRP